MLISLKNYAPFVYYENFLNDDEVNLIHQYSNTLLDEQAKVQTGDGIIRPDIRKSNVKWIDPAVEIDWLFEKIIRTLDEANSNYFHYDINSIEPLQYTTYNAPDNKYNAHADSNLFVKINERKISMTIQLSDPSEYEGGDLKIYMGSLNNTSIAKKRKGSLTFFKSYLLHGVEPVTKGTRTSLVTWFSGPPLK